MRGSNKEVVLKVLKPGVENVLQTDLNFLHVMSKVFEFINPELSRISLVDVVGDVRWKLFTFSILIISILLPFFTYIEGVLRISIYSSETLYRISELILYTSLSKIAGIVPFIYVSLAFKTIQSMRNL